MNILGCLDTRLSGEYVLSGEAVGHSTATAGRDRNKRIGFVFQNFNLLPYASARENVELPLLFGGVGTRERKERRRPCCAGWGWRTHGPQADRAERRPDAARRIARALVNDPAIVLADEPTGNLDSASGQAIVSLFRELHAGGPDIHSHHPRFDRGQAGRARGAHPGRARGGNRSVAA